MLGPRSSSPTEEQLREMKMISRLRIHANLMGFQQAAVRWRSSLKQAPLLTVAPARALIDEQVSIRGHFLPPHCPVTLCARLYSEDGDLWQAFAHYMSNKGGTVDLTCDHSLGGTYSGCEPMGLFWSLQPAPGGRDGLRLRKKNVETPYQVHISLLEGHVSPSGGPISEVATVTTERWYMAPGVKRTEIRQNRLVATLFLPPGPGPFPGVLDLWGMGGGLIEYRSALLASRGYASLSLAYIGHEELPGPPNQVNIGDQYLRSAYHLLQGHPQVNADRIGMIGLSFGVYLCLRIATQGGVNPSCLVCVNGPIASRFSIPDEDGLQDPLESGQEHWTYNDQGHVSFKDASSPAMVPPHYQVKIKDLSCPLMYIVGEDDLSSASTEIADQLEELLKLADKSHLFTRLSYRDAGHLIEPPYTPNARQSYWRIKPDKLMTVWGGHPAPHAFAQEDSWKKILTFLETNLRR